MREQIKKEKWREEERRKGNKALTVLRRIRQIIMERSRRSQGRRRSEGSRSQRSQKRRRGQRRAGGDEEEESGEEEL